MRCINISEAHGPPKYFLFANTKKLNDVIMLPQLWNAEVIMAWNVV